MGTKRNTKIEVILEKNDGMLWGRVEGKGNYLPTPYGENIAQVVQNLKELVLDYQAHEGKDDAFWKDVDIDTMEVSFVYDLQALFMEKSFLNVSAVADRAGINKSLMAQYAVGLKFPSAERVKKIEEAIHTMGNELRAVKIVAKESSGSKRKKAAA